MATLDGAPAVSALDSFIARSFGTEASEKIIALEPSAGEAALIYSVNDELRSQYGDKPDGFYPSPAALLVFARNYLADDGPAAMIDAPSMLEALDSAVRGVRALFAATERPKPLYATAVQYAIELAETGTLDRYPVHGQPNAPRMARLLNILSGEEYVVPERRSAEGSTEEEEVEGEQTEDAIVGSNALTLASAIAPSTLSRVGIDRQDFALVIQECGLNESEVTDLIHIHDSGGNTQTAIALLRAGHSMEDVRMVDDVRLALDSFVEMPEMMNLQAMEVGERSELLAGMRNLPIEGVIAFAEEFGFQEDADASAAGEDLAQAIVDVARTLDRRGRVALPVLLEQIIDESRESPPGTRGILEKVLDRFRDD